MHVHVYRLNKLTSLVERRYPVLCPVTCACPNSGPHTCEPHWPDALVRTEAGGVDQHQCFGPILERIAITISCT